jgi:hypothetical protein
MKLDNVNRRHFLKTALIGSAAMLSSGSALLEAAETPSRSRSYAALQSLRPGCIRPEGWIRLYLQKQASQLGISLPAASEPFDGAYWAGEEKYDTEGGGIEQSWWPWEQKGYWIDGALRCALLLNDEVLLKAATAPVEHTLGHAAPNGYLGPVALADPKVEYYRWPHTVFFRALAA